ncbi:MAG: hypothetical protein J6V80_01665 [Clostridia bacterium]|nr:hypothetical protein [Clostridia bacterium]
MKDSKNLEEYLLLRDLSLNRLDNAITQEKPYLRQRQYEPLIHSLSDMEKQHSKASRQISEAIDTLREIESVLEELKI